MTLPFSGWPYFTKFAHEVDPCGDESFRHRTWKISQLGVFFQKGKFFDTVANDFDFRWP